MILFENNYCQIEEVCLRDVKEQIKEKNPNFFNVIDPIKLTSQHTFIRVRLAYGIKIVDSGALKFPLKNGELVDLEHPDLPRVLKEKLSYCPIPLAFISHNANEVFVGRNGNIVPLNYFVPGDFFGVFETVDFIRGKRSAPTWTVTSGARSIFMLPKITGKSNYNKIKKKYNLTSDLPKNLMDQFNVYSELAQNNGGIKTWYNEVIFFSKEWFDKKDKARDIYWGGFYQYLFDLCLTQLDYFHVSTEISLALGHQFTQILSEISLKPRPYLMDTVKHLISIARGIAVGFRPAIDDSAAPIKMFEKIFINDYGLKDYAPLFIQPYKLWAGTQKPIYYSLSLPTQGDSSPYTRNPINIIDDQRDIRRLINILKHTASSVDAKISENIIIEILRNTEFEYFHCVPDEGSSIINSESIPKTDQDFDPKLQARPKSGKFCPNAPFMRGIIRIRRK